jgi:hypothetical protein
MPRSTKPSFVLELPLVVNSNHDFELQAGLNASMCLYNNVVGETYKRRQLVRKSEAYQAAKKLPKDKKKERGEAFNKARQAYRLTEYEIQAYANRAANDSKWIAQKVDSNTQQKLATRGFKAVERVLFGRAKKVRFNVQTRFHSVEGKSNKQGLRWVNDRVVWGKLQLPAIIDYSNEVIRHGLSSPVKYCGPLRRELNGKRRWFVQLVLEGLPYQKEKNNVADGLIGFEINISNIGYVADSHADLLPFAEGVPTYQKEITALQRKMQRSQRVDNPDNYEPDFVGRKRRKTVVKKGKVKKGKKLHWKRTKNYQRAAHKKRELERRKAAYAKSQNRRVVNEILRHGKHIRTEKVSVKGWQKRYGKAISTKSPGFVQSELKRKAQKAGGSFTTFETRKTALSQMHLTGNRIKKSLSEPVHQDETGVVMHRDLFSAFLSRHVNQDVLSLQDARDRYQRLESVLLEAWQRSINRKQVGASENRKSDSPSERFSYKGKKVDQIASKGEKSTPNLPESPSL